jgi:hypothetical protein
VCDVHAPIGDRKLGRNRETLVAGLLNLSGLLRGGFTSSTEGWRRFGARRIDSMGGVVDGNAESTGGGGNSDGVKSKSCDDGGGSGGAWGEDDRKGIGFCKGEEGETDLLSVGTSSGSYVP